MTLDQGLGVALERALGQKQGVQFDEGQQFGLGWQVQQVLQVKEGKR